MIIPDETDGLLLSSDRFVEIRNVTYSFIPTVEGASEAVEPFMFARVLVWGETDGLPLNHDRFVDIGNVT